jgi:hypothetical protein
VQASHLLQSRKDESNLETLCGEMTSKLKPKQVCTPSYAGKKSKFHRYLFFYKIQHDTVLLQIIAILQHYAPSDGFEERRLEVELLQKIAEKLTDRSRKSGEDNDQVT